MSELGLFGIARRALYGFALALGLIGCATSRPEAGSESHFLAYCDRDGECGGSLACQQGICTLACERDAECASLPAGASCEPGAPDDSVCDVTCDADRDCEALGRDFECGAGRCRQSTVSLPDAGTPDAGDPDGGGADGGVLGAIEPLGEAPELAFVTGYGTDEEIWVRGVNRALRRISVWPASDGVEDCSVQFGTGGYGEGFGRFSGLGFAPDGRYLLFGERVTCDEGEGSYRIVAHDLDSGESRTLLEVDAHPELAVSSELAVVITGNARGEEANLRIDEFVDGTLSRVTLPDAPVVNTGRSAPQLLRYLTRDVLLVDGAPPLVHDSGRLEPFAALEPLADPDLTISLMRDAPTGTALCAVVEDGARSHTGRVLDANGRWSSVAVTADAYNSCAVGPNADGAAFSSQLAAYEGADLKPKLEVSGFLPVGTYGNAYYGTLDDAVVRVDAQSGTVAELVPAQAVLSLCSSTFENQLTTILPPPDERPIALVKRYCGCIDCDSSGTLAVRLDTGAYEVIETEANHALYGVAWPVAGGALVYSSDVAPVSGGDGDVESFFHTVAIDGQVSREALFGGPLGPVHSLVTPRRMRTAATAPFDCHPEPVADMLLAGAEARDCGHIEVGDSRDVAMQCAREALADEQAFRILWDEPGTDSLLSSGYVGLPRDSGFELYFVDYDSFGVSPDGATVIWTLCPNTGVLECGSRIDGKSCRCVPHFQSGSGVDVQCTRSPAP